MDGPEEPGIPVSNAVSEGSKGGEGRVMDDRGGRAETAHKVAAGVWGRSPWPAPPSGPCGCPSMDGPEESVFCGREDDIA